MSIENTNKPKSPAIGCLVLGIFTGISGAIAYLIVLRIGFVEIFGIGPLIGPIIFLGISGLSFIGAMVLHYRFKTFTSKTRSFKNSSSPYESPYVPAYDTTSLDIDSRAILSDDHHVDWEKIAPLIYKGKITEEICPICKLSLEKKDTILQCPNCQSLFHDQHFIEWVIKNESCPTCFTYIDIH